MRCQECFELMSLKLDNMLTAPQAAKLDMLIRDCPDCARLWDALGESEGLLRAESRVQVAPPDPAAFTQAVMRKVAAQSYVLGAPGARNPRAQQVANRQTQTHFPWSAGAMRPQVAAWASLGLAGCLSIAAVTWLWLTSPLLNQSGNGAPSTRLALFQRAITNVGDEMNWPLLVGVVVFAAMLVVVWLLAVRLARRQLGEWEAE